MQALHQRWAERGAHPDGHAGMRAAEGFEQARHEILAARRIGSKREASQAAEHQSLYLMQTLRAQGEHALGIGEERAPRLTQLQRLSTAQEEDAAKRAFERGNPARDGGLCEVKQHCRARETPGTRHSDEGLQLIEGHNAPAQLRNPIRVITSIAWYYTLKLGMVGVEET